VRVMMEWGSAEMEDDFGLKTEEACGCKLGLNIYVLVPLFSIIRR